MLSDLLSITAPEATRHLCAPYTSIPDRDNRPIVLFGCGALGRRTASTLAQAGRPAIAFADNNAARWNNVLDGAQVLAPGEAVARYGDTAIFAVTIYNGAAARAQLAALGARHVLHFAALYHGISGSLLPWCALESPSAVLGNADDVLRGSVLWADERSRLEYEAQIAWRLGATAQMEMPHEPPGDIYFSSDVAGFGKDAVIVDCGAFDGDSLRLLLRQGHEFGAYFAIEPDPATFQRLTSCIADLPAELRAKLRAENAAVGASEALLRLTGTGEVDSTVTATGGIEIASHRLDDLLRGDIPALIKMDIEGAEQQALLGAAEILAQHRPMLAISAYHRSADLWEIPLLIKRLQPEYDLYLRRYAEDCWELVCYAIARKRMAA